MRKALENDVVSKKKIEDNNTGGRVLPRYVKPS